jgi:hypothetical protein
LNIKYSGDSILLIIDLFLIFVIILDVCLKALVFGLRKYFRTVVNILDALLVIIGVGSIFFVLNINNIYEETEEETMLLYVMILRNFNQILRIIVLLKNHTKFKVRYYNK